jgi:hypothetical protein
MSILKRSMGAGNSTPPHCLGLVSALLAGKTFQPLLPRSLEEAGLSETLVDARGSLKLPNMILMALVKPPKAVASHTSP